MITVDIPARLRRAIVQNDLALVKRILKKNPAYLQNPDPQDKSNTSLHLAAQRGLNDIAEYVVSLGHDNTEAPTDFIYLYSTTSQGPSYNTDDHTPLHLASSHSHSAVVELLCTHFPNTINKRDKNGSTPLHLASRAHAPPSATTSTFATKISTKAAEDTSTIETLIAHGANVHAQDEKGNTCLHYATAWGNLKAVRVLMQANADPLCRNKDGWTPEYYSVTVQAEVYYRNLVAEWEKRRAEEEMRMRERKSRGGAGVRLVTADEDETDDLTLEYTRSRADSRATTSSTTTSSGLGASVGKADGWR